MTPAANAADSAGELSRMSWPITTWAASAAHQTREGGTDIGHKRLVDLLADEATHVICLDHTGNRRSGSRHN